MLYLAKSVPLCIKFSVNKEPEDSVPGITRGPLERQEPELQPQEGRGSIADMGPRAGRGHWLSIPAGLMETDPSHVMQRGALTFPTCGWARQVPLGLGLREGQRQQKLGYEREVGSGGRGPRGTGCSLVIRTFEL